VRDPRAGYDQSLSVLKMVKEMSPNIFTKTSLMLGLGETEAEILETLKDLRAIDCDVITFGQYLQPTEKHLKVERFVTPEEFEKWRLRAEEMGFLYVASGPLVRSSYRAGEYFMAGMIERRRQGKPLTPAEEQALKVEALAEVQEKWLQNQKQPQTGQREQGEQASSAASAHTRLSTEGTTEFSAGSITGGAIWPQT
jgi:lipoic acid synthetase